MKYLVILVVVVNLYGGRVYGQLPEQPVLVKQPHMLQLLAADARLEILADGFSWAEGPVVEPSGYTGLYPAKNQQQGANGLAFSATVALAPDKRYLYITATHYLLRIALLTR